MERQFQINWPVIVEEARQRRKKLNLTQQRLAALANVSTPTVSRFENGEKDIQLSTVTSILTVLGMTDERRLLFESPSEHYDYPRRLVVFTGKDGEKTVLCAIERAALEDHFGGDKKDSIKVFLANRERIEHEARRKYLAGELEPDGSVLIRTVDI